MVKPYRLFLYSLVLVWLLSACESPLAVPVPERPSVPQILSSNTLITADSVTLAWLPSDNASHYRIEYRKETASTWNVSDTQPISGLEANTYYIFRVFAINDVGRESEPSSSIGIYTKLKTPIIQCTVIDHHTIELAWEAVSGADTYEIYLNTTDTRPEQAHVLDIAKNSCTIDTLEQNHRYYFWVRARSKNTESDFALTNAATGLYPITLTDLNINQNETTKNSIALFWETIDGADSYEIQYLKQADRNTASPTWIPKKDIKEPHYIIEDLAENTIYIIRIRSHNSNGGSIFSNELQVNTRAAESKSFRTADITVTSIHLIWEPANAAYYLIKWSKNADYQSGAQTKVSDTTFSVNELTENTCYYFSLISVDIGEHQSAEQQLSCFTLLAKPTNIQTQSVSDTEIKVLWDSKTGANGYIVETYLATNQTTPYKKSEITTATSYTVSGLTQNTQYSFAVRAVNTTQEAKNTNNGNPIEGEPSDKQAEFTLLTTPNASSIVQPYSRSIALALPAGGSYDVHYNTQDIFNLDLRSNTQLITTATYTVTGLTENTVYYFWIVARNTNNDSKPSQSINCFTLLAKPTNVQTESVSDTEIKVSWDPKTGANGYIVETYATNQPDFYKKSEITTATSYTVSGLTPNTQYAFAVRAVNTTQEAKNTNNGNPIEGEQSDKQAGLTSPNAPSIVQPYSRSIALALPAGGSYDVYYNTQDIFNPELRSNTQLITTATYTVTGLTENTRYYFWIVARNEHTSSKPSQSINCFTLLAKPTNVQTNSVSDTEIKVSWDPKTGANGYIVETYATNQTTPDKKSEISTATSYTVSGLTQNTQYAFAVRALNTTQEAKNTNNGNPIEGEQSDKQAGLTLLTTPNAPSIVQPYSRSIALALPAGGSYDVYYNTQDIFNLDLRSNTQLVTTATYTVTGLTENTVYYFWIVARNTNNDSKPSQSVSGKTIQSLITINFANPADPVITGMPSEIRKVQKDSYTISVINDGWDSSYQWLLDGDQYATGNSCTIDWNLPVGSHVLTVIVTKSGVPYSVGIRFTVVNK